MTLDGGAPHATPAEAALREFVSNTTHDLGTPLTVLSATLARLRNQLSRREPLEPTALDGAIDEVHYMAALVHNLALAAKLAGEEPDLVRGPTDLGAVIVRTTLRNKPIAAALEVELNFAVPEVPIEIDADVILTERAISNLVENAVRHNLPRGHVAVVLEHTDVGFVVSITDDGPGIGAEEIARAFDDESAPSSRRRRQGLGLRIAHRIAKMHGWQLAFVPREIGARVEIRGEALGADSPAPGEPSHLGA